MKLRVLLHRLAKRPGKICGLAISLYCTVSAFSSPVLITENVGILVPLSSELILCEMSTGYQTELFTVNIETREISEWEADWGPEEEGWFSGGYWDLDISPDREWLCMARCVWVPQEFEHGEAGRSAIAIILCRPDGSEAEVVALGADPLGGEQPQYDFTTDSRYLVGSSILHRFYNAEDYSSYIDSSKGLMPVEEVNCFDLNSWTLKRVDHFSPGLTLDSPLLLTSSYLKCPYSDNVAVQNNRGEGLCTYVAFGNFISGELLGEYRIPIIKTAPGDFPYGYVEDWVLPDALLFIESGRHGLLYTNGTFQEAPTSDCEWVVYCWLPDNTYLFSRDGGQTIEYGEVDWNSFTVLSSTERPDLWEFRWNRFTPIPGTRKVLISSSWQTGPLYLIELD